ncbi:DNA-binding PadR family transcriptional regulator [Allocatelliglobosispora scoriae]|uniref:DNA-binding PadR family transcriptional regulator n=1 Tax=Allocatelliglobosispora scoriae TaxID=643052 RepID=A0A841BI84_9ACTN|nr:helix-turn-helix transcriptional regulator [Allocatelliglobosispora scoriae]MBB5868827.1 DNA-binding PadR family transcriptional regulator [Allocatelliglobosispora scoriae]
MSGPKLRVTPDVARLLQEFLQEPTQPRYGYDLMASTGFPSGKIYPMFAKLVAAEWLVKERENIDPAAEGRPVRHFYRINPDMIAVVRQELAALSQYIAPRPATALRPGFGHA